MSFLLRVVDQVSVAFSTGRTRTSSVNMFGTPAFLEGPLYSQTSDPGINVASMYHVPGMYYDRFMCTTSTLLRFHSVWFVSVEYYLRV